MSLKKTNSANFKKVPAWMLLLTAFITGNVIMMIEVVGTRVVAPYFGVGVYVWSALITVALLALAAGYGVGGYWADLRRRPEWLYLIIVGSSLFTFLIPILRYPILTGAEHLGVRGGALVGSALLFGPALFLLGMVSPYIVKLYTENFEKIGRRVGLLYSVSTIGSFFGTLTMGFYLIPLFRLSTIIVSLGGILLLMPLIYFFLFRSQRRLLFFCLIAAGLGTLIFFPRVPRSLWVTDSLKIIHKATSFYGELKVLESSTHRTLLIDGIIQSGDDLRLGQASPPYVFDTGSLISRYCPAAQSALVIGLGGGNLAHLLLKKNLTVEVAEIDRKVVDVAKRFFNIDPRQVKITIEDGRRYLRQTDKKYDVVVLNAFSGESFPSHMLTQECFGLVKKILNPQGVVLLNFVGYVQGPHRQSTAALYATIKSEFTWCRVFFREPKSRFGNVLYAAGEDTIPENQSQDANWDTLKEREVTISGWETAPVVTDDYNPIEFLNRMVYKRWRQLVIDTFGPEILLN